MFEQTVASSEIRESIADVAVAGARSGAEGLLSYETPAALRDALTVGQVVWVPLRGKPALGVIAELHDDRPPFALKAMLGAVVPPTRVSDVQLQTARWLARETAT